MTGEVRQEFDFVSDWIFALAPSELIPQPTIPPITTIRHLGPICELARGLAHFRQVPMAESELPFETQTTRHLLRAIREGSAISAKEGLGAVGFISFRDCDSIDEAVDKLTTFVDHASGKCIEIGIPKRLAQASTGAMEEMSNNALRHSMNLQSAVTGFRAQKHLFEFVTFDVGIGILRSLKQDGYYSELDDEAEALELAIADGVSRHGPGRGHGNGFRQIFNMPNNHAGYFWLHSGEHALVVDGGALVRPDAHVRQVNRAGGVLTSAAFLV